MTNVRRAALILLTVLTSTCGEDPSPAELEPQSQDWLRDAATDREPDSSSSGRAPHAADGGRKADGATSDSGLTLGDARAGGGAETGASSAGSDIGASGSDAGGEDPVCELPDPSTFQPNAGVGGGGAQFKDSHHFRVYGTGAGVDAALKHLEAAHKCFVEDWCFRSPGLSVHADAGPYYKFNVYGVGSLNSAAGVMQYDARAGLSYLEVVNGSLGDPRVTVHEFGHALTLTEYGWVDQIRTGAWWEAVANWVADTYLTSPQCEAARKAFGVAADNSLINLNTVIGQSHLMILANANRYEAWPIFTYLTNNPDGYPGLGRMALLELFRQHMRNNETPLHVLERVAAPVKVQTILGRYWARMAYLDIGHAAAQRAFLSRRGSLNYANLDAMGSDTYSVKPSRQPQYGGANIIPLSGSGELSVQVMNLGNGRPESNFTASLAMRASDGSVRYQELTNGAGTATVAAGEQASLVVVNTPDQLYHYDAFKAGAPETTGLNYLVQITGATPAN